jgi:TolB-like protein
MKNDKIYLVMALIISTGLTVSCVSIQDRTMTPQEREEAEIIGSVTTEFTSTNFLHIKSGIENKAYAELKKVAQQKYSGNIDIKNIVIAGSFSGWNILWGMVYLISPILLDVQKITASGDVVLYRPGSTGDSAPPAKARSSGSTEGIEGAINRACDTLLNDIPRRSTVAVLSVSSRDRNMAVFVVDEIEFQLVDARQFDMVDRKTLDSIRDEQNFQMSGDVSDSAAVSIGNMLGASVVITGAITGSDDTQRLTVKALDVKTARIITMAREQY